MADLKRRDRGQIILVAAFALAVIFLTLALVVNSAIFTENLASRSDTTGSDGALSDRAAVERNVGDALEAANRNNASHSDQAQSVNNSLASYRTQVGQQQATSGKLVNVSYTANRTGRRITNDTGTFESNSGSADYNLVTGVSRVPNGNGTRAFVINATLLPGSSNPFNISVVGTSGARWTTEIWENTDEVVIETERVDSTGTVTASDDCRVSAGDSGAPVIDVTRGIVNGRPCDALGTTDSGTNLHFGAGTDDSYRIRFENAAQIEGAYSLIVNDDGSLGAINTGGTDEDALYQVTVEYSYTTTDMRYVTEIRVAPGEPNA